MWRNFRLNTKIVHFSRKFLFWTPVDYLWCQKFRNSHHEQPGYSCCGRLLLVELFNLLRFSCPCVCVYIYLPIRLYITSDITPIAQLLLIKYIPSSHLLLNFFTNKLQTQTIMVTKQKQNYKQRYIKSNQSS